MRSASSFVFAAALAMSGVQAQQCQGSAKMCDETNESHLLVCNGGTWDTQVCGSNQYCMTMDPTMIHCMLKPDNADDSKSSSSSHASPTSSPESSSSHSSSESSSSSKKDDEKSSKSTTSGASGSGNIAVIAAIGAAAIGMAALF
ncbi:hypothetical protein GGI07_005043 [Coemansia sp. Benny D115]|nr:hypothetical protein GGI07_005043 [Coemansia sp. Benny D115]